jgi:hypothetical protein
MSVSVSERRGASARMTAYRRAVSVTVVIATRDRRASLLATLERLAALPERPPVVVVDNGIGGEEELLALDLAAAGWTLHYVDDVVAHHDPAPGARGRRSRVQVRNALWSCWLRRPAPRALVRSATILAGAGRCGAPALVDALRSLRWVARHRRVIPSGVERAVRRLE